jgi:hypothetical protein
MIACDFPFSHNDNRGRGRKTIQGERRVKEATPSLFERDETVLGIHQTCTRHERAEGSDKRYKTVSSNSNKVVDTNEAETWGNKGIEAVKS